MSLCGGLGHLHGMASMLRSVLQVPPGTLGPSAGRVQLQPRLREKKSDDMAVTCYHSPMKQGAGWDQAASPPYNGSQMQPWHHRPESCPAGDFWPSGADASKQPFSSHQLMPSFAPQGAARREHSLPHAGVPLDQCQHRSQTQSIASMRRQFLQFFPMRVLRRLRVHCQRPSHAPSMLRWRDSHLRMPHLMPFGQQPS